MGSKNKSAAPATAAEWKRGTWKEGKYKNTSGTIFSGGPANKSMGAEQPQKKKRKDDQMGQTVTRDSVTGRVTQVIQ